MHAYYLLCSRSSIPEIIDLTEDEPIVSSSSSSSSQRGVSSSSSLAAPQLTHIELDSNSSVDVTSFNLPTSSIRERETNTVQVRKSTRNRKRSRHD